MSVTQKDLKEALNYLECIHKHCSAKDANLSMEIVARLATGKRLSAQDLAELKRMCTDEKEILCQLRHCPLSKAYEAKQERSLHALRWELPPGKQTDEVMCLLTKGLELRKKLNAKLGPKKNKDGLKRRRRARSRSRSRSARSRSRSRSRSARSRSRSIKRR